MFLWAPFSVLATLGPMHSFVTCVNITVLGSVKMKNRFLFCARSDPMVLFAKIQTFPCTKIQERGIGLPAFFVLYQMQCPGFLYSSRPSLCPLNSGVCCGPQGPASDQALLLLWWGCGCYRASRPDPNLPSGNEGGPEMSDSNLSWGLGNNLHPWWNWLMPFPKVKTP